MSGCDCQVVGGGVACAVHSGSKSWLTVKQEQQQQQQGWLTVSLRSIFRSLW